MFPDDENDAVQTVRMLDGAGLQVEITGSGRDVVLISGLGGTGAFWTPLIDSLGDGFRAIRFDQRGIGGSERGTDAVTIQALAEDAWDVIDATVQARPILWGHSTGGAIVQEMALMRPEQPAGLVLSGSWAGPDPIFTQMFEHRLDVLDTSPVRYGELAAFLAVPPRWSASNPTFLRDARRNAPVAGQIPIVRERIQALLAHDCRERLGEITPPSLILGAEDDMIVPPYLQEEIARAIKGAELHMFATGGHFFPITRPADTADQFRGWLARHVDI